MNRDRHYRLAPILTGLLLIAVPTAVYLAGYFWLPDRLVFWSGNSGAGVRVSADRFPGAVQSVQLGFAYRLMADIYRPAAVFESRLRGVAVSVSWEGQGIELLE